MKYVDSSSNEVARHGAELRAWLDGCTAQSAAASNRQHLAKSVDETGQLGFLAMHDSLTALPRYLLAKGVRQVLELKPVEGWSSIRDSAQMLVLWWQGTRARARRERLSLNGVSIGLKYYQFSHAALLSLVLAERATADWCAEAVVAMSADGIAAASCLPGDDIFPTWIASVSAAWLGLPRPAGQVRPNSELFDLADRCRDDAVVTKLLPDLLNYHMWRCDQRKRSRNPDQSYHQTGLALLPTVSYALAAIRRKDGIKDLPEIDHPLAALPTWNIPGVTQTSDPLIDAVARRTRRMEVGEY